MSQKDPDRPDLNRREKHILEMLIVATSEITKGSDVLRDRLTMVDRRGYSSLRLALGHLHRVEGLIYETMPTRQLRQLQTACRTGVVTLNLDRTLLPKGYVPVADMDLNTIAAAAVNNKCALCLMDERECQSCPLRKSLITLWPPKEYNKYGRCPYQGVRWAEDATDSIEEDE